MVEGVALELLCRLLFTEGSNPSLSVRTFYQSMLLTTIYHMDPFISLVRPFFDMIWIFFISNFCGPENTSKA